jgi:hypothetical protein
LTSCKPVSFSRRTLLHGVRKYSGRVLALTTHPQSSDEYRESGAIRVFLFSTGPSWPVTFSSSISAFIHAFFLFLRCLLASRLTLFKSSTLFWLGSCIHCILACFLRSKHPKCFPSNHGLCYTCFDSCRPGTSLAEVWTSLLNVLPSPIYVPVIVQVLQNCKPVCNLNVILFPNLQPI